MQKEVYAIILAGGNGTRLYPLSTQEKPKQFHALLSHQTLLQETVMRAQSLTRRDHIFVATLSQYKDIVTQQLVNIPHSHIIVEPCLRDTLPAMTLATWYIYQRDPDAIIIFLSSDHAVKNTYDFISAVHTARNVIEENHERIGVIGITQTAPNTAFGYIQKGNEIQGFQQTVFGVKSFHEKPNASTAKQYFRSEDYLWNGGYFIFKADYFLKCVEKYSPNVITVIKDMQNVHNEDRKTIFAKTPKISVSHGLIEHMNPQNLFVVPADLGWSDIGTWETLYQFLPKTGENVILPDGEVNMTSTAKNNLIFCSPGIQCTVSSVEDLLVICHEQQVIICRLDESANLKDFL